MKKITFNTPRRASFFPVLFFCAFYQESSMFVSLPQYFLICTLVYFKNGSDSVIFLIEQSVPPCTLISSVQLNQIQALGILKWRHTCLVPKPWCWVWSRSDTTSPFLQVGEQPYSFPTGVECCLPSICPISLYFYSIQCGNPQKSLDPTGERGPKDPDPCFVHHPPPLVKASVCGDQATMGRKVKDSLGLLQRQINRHSQGNLTSWSHILND